MGKVLRNVLIGAFLAIPLLYVSFGFEAFSGRLVGPGERISRFYQRRQAQKVTKKIQEARASSDRDADAKILRMLEDGTVEGRNVRVAVFALGEKRSQRSVERIVRIMRESFGAEGDPLVFQACAEALGKIGGKDALDALQYYYDISTKPDDPNYWRARVLDADKVLKDAIEAVSSQAL